MARGAKSQFTFADLEFLAQGVCLEPVLQAMAGFLDRQADVVELVRQDLERGLKHPATGRRGMSPVQVLRSLIVQRVKTWDYRELRERIADGYTLRCFTDFYSEPVPQHDAFHRAFQRLTPATLRAINELVVRAAVGRGLEDGKALRTDTTVVETDIHYPTDSTLLGDTVRVVTRLVKRLGKLVPEAVTGFPNRTRAARRRGFAIERMSAQQRHQRQRTKYQQLIGIAEQVVGKALAVLETGAAPPGIGPASDLALHQLRHEIAHYCDLGKRVIEQTRRRVLQGEPVPNEEKIFSIFEPHTDLIKRGKVLKPVEFGHKVYLAESARGLITDYRVLDGNPSDSNHVEPSLQQHRKTFGQAPELYAADRGFYSQDNVNACEQAGVTLVCIPQRGGKKTPQRQAFEKSAAFKRGQRFRTGIEGRISVLFRGRGMKRCLAKGRVRFELLVGSAVLANNLMVIAELLRDRPARRRRAA